LLSEAAPSRGAHSVSEDEKDILLRMGIALLQIQLTEGLIRSVMQLVLPKTSPLTYDLLQQQKQLEMKKTLGHFLRELRKRVDLDDRFEVILLDFLDKRNTFVHRIFEVPQFSLQSVEGRQHARNFLDSLMKQSVTLQKVFCGLIRSWLDQNELDVPIQSDSILEKFLAEIDKDYKPLVQDIFFEKG
jgi:hypothetical protein